MDKDLFPFLRETDGKPPLDPLDLYATFAEASADLKTTASTAFAAHSRRDKITRNALETAKASAWRVLSACSEYEKSNQ